jgi:carbonic anhydrase/acetyltransferase-like protein (isoleucine patch superfamily)
MNGAHIGHHSIIAAGTLVPEGMQIPPGSVYLGAPARRHREALDSDRRMISTHAANYVEYKNQYLAQH